MNNQNLSHLDNNKIRNAIAKYYDGTIDDSALDELKLDAAEYVSSLDTCSDEEKSLWTDIDADLRVLALTLDSELAAIPEVRLPESLSESLDRHISALVSESEHRVRASFFTASRLKKIIASTAAVAAAITIIAIALIRIDNQSSLDSMPYNFTAALSDSSEYARVSEMESPSPKSETKQTATATIIPQKAAKATSADADRSYKHQQISNMTANVAVRTDANRNRPLREEAIRMLEDAGYHITKVSKGAPQNGRQLASNVFDAINPAIEAINSSISDFGISVSCDETDDNIHETEPIIYEI